MEYALQTQTIQFFLSGALGIALGIHYDFLRAIRQIHRRLTVLLDLWFCVTMLGAMLAIALYAGQGQFHLFMFIGTALGAILYFLGPGRWLLRGFTYFFGFFAGVRSKIKKFFKKAFSNGVKSVRILFNKIGMILRRQKRGEAAHENQIQKGILGHKAHHRDRAGLRHSDTRLSSTSAFRAAAVTSSTGNRDFRRTADQRRATSGHRRNGHRRGDQGRSAG